MAGGEMFRGKTLVLEERGDTYAYKDAHTLKTVKPAEMKAFLESELARAQTRADEVARALVLLDTREAKRTKPAVKPKKFPMGHSGASEEEKRRGAF